MKIKEAKQRNSSIELLRILFILSIVLFHFLGRNYSLFGITNESAVWDSNLLLKLIVHSTGQLGVPGFVFISGYFGLRYNNFRFIDIVFQCLIYSFVFYAIIAPLIGVFETRTFVLSAFFLSNWWFIWAYIVLYYLSPGLNNFIDSMSKRQFIVLIVLLVFISTGLWVFKTSATNIFILIEIYFIARYSKIHLQNIKMSRVWIILVLSVFIYYGSVVISYYYNNLKLMSYVNSYYNPIILVLSCSLIVAFARVKFYSKIINWLSPNLLAAYLITENFYGQVLFKDLFYSTGNFPILKFVGFGLLLIVICVLIDKGRLFLMGGIQKRWASKLEKWLV
ncbi:hypothetical protein MHTCC0001_33690 [Flavobacteriaceae bacterium MHTCC 0001]